MQYSAVFELYAVHISRFCKEVFVKAHCIIVSYHWHQVEVCFFVQGFHKPEKGFKVFKRVDKPTSYKNYPELCPFKDICQLKDFLRGVIVGSFGKLSGKSCN